MSQTSFNLKTKDFENDEEVACNFCGKKDMRLFQSKRIESLGKKFRFMQCRSCRLIYLNPRPTQEALNKLYSSSDYFQGKGQSVAYYDYVGEETFRKATARLKLHEIEKIQGRRGRLLEVGCAAGFFIATARDEGWEVTGLDVSETMARVAKEKYSLDVIVNRFEDIDPSTHKVLKKGHFDVIYCWGTTGTLSDPLGSFKKMHELLKEDGLLVFSASNSESLSARILGKKWFILAPSGLHVYNRKALEILMEKSGFSPRKIGIAQEFFTPYKVLTKLVLIFGPRWSRLVERFSKVSWAHRSIRIPNFGTLEIYAGKKT